MRLGARLVFLGINARTERTCRSFKYPETYGLIFERIRSELSMEENCRISHLLRNPIAYPRLIWLEPFLTSLVIGFDDHYTARRHRHDRKNLLLHLQSLAQDHPWLRRPHCSPWPLLHKARAGNTSRA